MSTPTGQHHHNRGTTRAHALATVLLVLLVSVATLATGTAPASAYWSSSGSAAATSATATLSAPVDVTVPETAPGEIPVSWTPGTGGVQPAGYYVTRSNGDTTAPACASSPTSLIDGDSCTDADVPVGDHTYVVTAVYASWTAPSAPSSTVTVTAPDVLGAAQSYPVLAATAMLPPTLGIDGGPAATTKDTTPTISGVSHAPASSPVSVVVDGQSLSTTVTAGGTWTVTATELTAGRYEVAARVRDADGNGVAATQDLTVEVNPPPVGLGSAASYSVLAATGVVSTGATTMSGDLGVSPETSATGFPPGTYDGSLHAGDDAAASAQEDLLDALDEAISRAPHTEIAGDLGGQTFHAGVHHMSAALALTGTVTLDAEDDPDSVFVFLTDAAFDTAAASNVSLVNGAQPANVFWVAAGGIGTGANSSMSGALLSRGAITLGAGTALTGQALSRDTVTMADSTLTGVAPAPVVRRAPSEEARDEPAEQPEPSPSTPPEASDVPAPAEPSQAPDETEAPDATVQEETAVPDEPAVPEETVVPNETPVPDATPVPEETAPTGEPVEESAPPAGQVEEPALSDQQEEDPQEESSEQDKAAARDPADSETYDEATVTS